MSINMSASSFTPSSEIEQSSRFGFFHIPANNKNNDGLNIYAKNKREFFEKLIDKVEHGEKLDKFDFSKISAAGANLSGLPLYKLGANALRQIDFAGADLSNQNFAGMGLRKFNAPGAILTGANFEGADLSEANLQSARISNASFSSANAGGANLNFAQGSNTNMNGAFGGAGLAGVDLSNPYMGTDCFVNANLSGAKMTGMEPGDADFSFANLRGAELSSEDLSNNHFAGADLTNAKISAKTLDLAKLDKTQKAGLALSFGRAVSSAGPMAAEGARPQMQNPWKKPYLLDGPMVAA